MARIKVKTAHGFDEAVHVFKESSYEERPDEVERLRLEAEKYLYEYPARLQRVLAAVRKICRRLHGDRA